MRELFDKNEAKIGSVLVLSVVAFFFFSFISVNSVKTLFNNDLSLNSSSNDKSIYLGRMSDNIYLQSDRSIEGEVLIKVRFVDGKESDFIKVGRSGSNNNAEGYTSELITFNNYIEKVIIRSSAKDDITIGNLNDGIYSLFRFEGAVLGLTTERQDNEILFLQKNNMKVVSRDEWDDEFDRNLVADNDEEYVDIQDIYIYSVDNLNPGSDLEKVRAIRDFQKLRCKEVPGIAPVSCTVEEVKGDVSYNYILGPNGVVYQGMVGGNGIAGTHNGEDDDSISIAVMPDQNKEYNQVEHLQKLLSSLASVNGLGEDPTKFIFVNSSDSESFQKLSETALSFPKPATPEETEKPVEESKSIFEGNEIVRSGENVQLLISKDSSEQSKEIVARVSEPGSSQETKEYDSAYVDQDVAEQIVAEALLVDPEAKIQPNYIYKIDSWDNSDPERSIPSDYNTSTHWYHDKTNLPEAWKDLGGCVADNTCGGDGLVKVAVLDTGVAYENFNYDAGGSFSAIQFDPFYVEVPSSDVQNGVYNEGYDRQYVALPELSNVTFTAPYDSWQDYSCNVLRLTGAEPAPCNTFEVAKIDHANDDHGHGTFVTSIIAANTSDLAPNRVVGMSHNIQIIPIKVFTPNDKSMCLDEYGNIDITCSYAYGDYRSVAFTTTIVEGIDHAVSNGAKVINMSLGGAGTDTLVEAAIDDAVTAEVLVVVSSGNDNDDAQYYFPANSPGAFTVGSTTPTDTRASYSNYGYVLDLVAPVGDSSTTKVASIRYQCSTDASCSDETDPNLFQTFTSDSSPNQGIGTSYAAPQVAAAAALLWADTPAATLAEVKDALQQSATDLGDVGYDQEFGYGLLNVQGALGREQNVPEPIKQFFTWYDARYPPIKYAWVVIGNPSATEVANVNVKIPGVLNYNTTVQPGEVIAPLFNGMRGGPMIVTSNIDVHATQRVRYYESFNEYGAWKESDLSNKYYFTWYDSNASTKLAWIMVGNPSETTTANVNIKVGDSVDLNYQIPPGEVITPIYPYVQSRPVVIESDINVFATQRVRYFNSFNEYPGLINN